MAEQTFHEFITEWRRQRLATMSKAEVAAASDDLGKELSQAALQGGHRSALTKACRPYRAMSEYVKALHDISDTKHRKD